LVASKIVENGSDPFYVTLIDNRVVPTKKDSGSGGGLSQGAKIAIAVIVIVAFFVIAGFIVFWQRENLRWYLRRRKLGLRL